VAANISRRGTTVLTYDITEERFVMKSFDQLKSDIASEERFITKQREKMDRMRSLEAGVRSGDISTDLAMFQISINNAEARISIMKKELENMKHG
jgi:hypothetical protein